MLRIEELGVTINGTPLIQDFSLTVSPGEIVGLVGPNGSGKTTALRCVYRALRPNAGRILLDGEDLIRMDLRSSARQVAALTQQSGLDLDFTAAEIVQLGRAPHLAGNQNLSQTEMDICRQAMEDLDVEHLARRGMLSLSGGEKQRVLMARALAQSPRLLVLDEPTNHLDMRHQIELLSLLRNRGMTVLVVLHDLNLAAAACDRLAVLREGRLVTAGKPRDVIDSRLLKDVFDVDAEVVAHPLTGDPQLVYSLKGTT